eukprot:2076254-Amphidinium_carterae.1
MVPPAPFCNSEQSVLHHWRNTSAFLSSAFETLKDKRPRQQPRCTEYISRDFLNAPLRISDEASAQLCVYGHPNAHGSVGCLVLLSLIVPGIICCAIGKNAGAARARRTHMCNWCQKVFHWVVFLPAYDQTFSTSRNGVSNRSAPAALGAQILLQRPTQTQHMHVPWIYTLLPKHDHSCSLHGSAAMACEVKHWGLCCLWAGGASEGADVDS